jgi:hypothetical protein
MQRKAECLRNREKLTSSKGIVFPECRRDPRSQASQRRQRSRPFEASKYSKAGKKGAKAQEEEHNCHWIS